ncbi:acidic leucine-rich nuclear phosphoprotein 32 family member A [Tanacetum coccineum]
MFICNAEISLPPPVPHSPEHIDMDAFFEYISANNVPTPPTQTTEVDAPPVNDDNANANEGNAEDDDVAHVLDDDDVVVSDDDEVNPSTNVEEMACVFPRSHGGDAGGSPPRRPNRPVPAQCESSNLRIETGNASLRRAFRQNGQRPLTIGFDYGDLGTFHPTGDYSSMLNSLMGETVKYLPLACEWEEIPEAYKAHIFPTLESYFDLASWYNNQDKVVMGNNVYTVGDRVKLGLQLKLRILWRKNKQRIKADHFTRYGSAEEARNHLPPKKVWGDRTEDEWNNLVDWWSHPDRVARSLQNAANRAKNTILTHQGKKSFAQGRNEYVRSRPTSRTRPDQVSWLKSFRYQPPEQSEKGRKLPVLSQLPRRAAVPQAFPGSYNREELDRILGGKKIRGRVFKEANLRMRSNWLICCIEG